MNSGFFSKPRFVHFIEFGFRNQKPKYHAQAYSTYCIYCNYDPEWFGPFNGTVNLQSLLSFEGDIRKISRM
jgi:hypothetical protein